MKKILALAMMALLLASCGPRVGDFVYVHTDTGTKLGVVVGTSSLSDMIAVRLCGNGGLTSGSAVYFIEAEDGTVCP